MKNLTIIIPVVGLTDTLKKAYFDKAIASIKSADPKDEAQVLVVGPKESLSLLSFRKKNYKLLQNDGDTSFSAQINFAVENCTTDYFSILEFDDEFTPHWFENVEKYSAYFESLEGNEDKPSFYLPLTEVYDITEPGSLPMQYLNEAYWASSFSDTLGFFDAESLTNYMKVNVFGIIFSGGVFKKDDFLNIGGLKPSFKLTFWQEFALRAMHKAKKIFVVPKVGYNHYAKRPDSMSEKYLSEMTQKEIDWWISLAEKECFFKDDRKKTYEE